MILLKKMPKRNSTYIIKSIEIQTLNIQKVPKLEEIYNNLTKTNSETNENAY